MKIFIAVPCMEQLDVDFVRSLMTLEQIGEVMIDFVSGSLVYTAREELAKKATACGAEYILWLDSDMVFEPSTLKNLMEDIEGGKDFVSGLYFRRRAEFNPVLYKTIRMGSRSLGDSSVIEQYDDYPKDSIFEIDACGFGCVLMKTAMLWPMAERYHAYFQPLFGYGEDISFCIRAKELGFKLYCDSRVKLKHIAKTYSDEEHYLSWRGTHG